MTKRQFLIILYLLVGIIPLIAQTFTEQKKSYPVSADGNKYVVSGFTPFSDMQDENIYANALLWTVKNVCPQLREGIAEVNVPAKNFSCDLILASQADSSQKNTYYCKALFQVKATAWLASSSTLCSCDEVWYLTAPRALNSSP